jgi:hypothetical protein
LAVSHTAAVFGRVRNAASMAPTGGRIGARFPYSVKEISMRTMMRTVVVAAGALLFAGMLPSPAQASPPVTLHVRGEAVWEAVQSCPPPTAVGNCTVVGGNLTFSIYWTSTKAPGQFTVGWEVFGGTMTYGSDYTGPTSGVATIAAGQGQTYVSIPLVNDGLVESSETLNLRVTSSSIPADFSSAVDSGTVWDGAQIPSDCTAARVNQYAMSIGCTARPASQQWQTIVDCFNPWNIDSAYGPLVTGNGTSLASCGSTLFKAYNPFFYIEVA